MLNENSNENLSTITLQATEDALSCKKHMKIILELFLENIDEICRMKTLFNFAFDEKSVEIQLKDFIQDTLSTWTKENPINQPDVKTVFESFAFRNEIHDLMGKVRLLSFCSCFSIFSHSFEFR